MQQRDIKYQTDRAVRKYLETLIRALDELDGDNYFDRKGWRYFLMGES